MEIQFELYFYNPVGTSIIQLWTALYVFIFVAYSHASDSLIPSLFLTKRNILTLSVIYVLNYSIISAYGLHTATFQFTGTSKF